MSLLMEEEMAGNPDGTSIDVVIAHHFRVSTCLECQDLLLLTGKGWGGVQ